MKRIQIHSTAKPKSRALNPAIASITRGLSNRRATSAPAHSPTCEAAQAQIGVRSQPTTSKECASHRGTVVLLPLAREDDESEHDQRHREPRSEERRVGKEFRSRWAPYH